MMKFPIWTLRILILCYMFYKLFLADAALFMNVGHEGKSTAAAVGEIIGLSLVFIAFVPFYIYQIKQIRIEAKQSNAKGKNKFRLYSIIFSLFFFSLSSLGLISIFNSKIDLSSHQLYFFEIFTVLAILMSIVVSIKDILLHIKYNHLKNP